MGLIINAFYTNKEIFLREIVSNASDALDKLKYKYITQGNYSDSEYEIKIYTDKESKILVVEDTGIGMTKNELITNLGTIARSGTKQFIQAMKDQKDMSLIGQFGVGFYSAFLIANRISVISKSEDDENTWEWTSDAGGTFQVSQRENGFNNQKLNRGTQIVMFIKDDC